MFCLSTQHANFLQTTNCTEKSCEYFIWPAPADMHCHYLMIHTDHAMISIYMIKWPQWRHALLNHHLPHHSPVRDLRPTCSSQYRRWANAAHCNMESGPGCGDHSSMVTRAWLRQRQQFIRYLGSIGSINNHVDMINVSTFHCNPPQLQKKCTKIYFHHILFIHRIQKSTSPIPRQKLAISCSAPGPVFVSS